MSQFATAAELATFLRRTFTSQEDDAADIILKGVTTAIQKHTGQKIELVTDDDVTLRGTWSTELKLPQWPVVSVSSVSINGAAAPAGTWWLRGSSLFRGILPVVNGPDDWGGDLRYSSWLGPLAVIGVVYTHGLDPLPDDVKQICLQAGARAFSRPDGTSSETIGNYSYSSPQGDVGELLSAAEKAALDYYGQEL